MWKTFQRNIYKCKNVSIVGIIRIIVIIIVIIFTTTTTTSSSTRITIVITMTMTIYGYVLLFMYFFPTSIEKHSLIAVLLATALWVLKRAGEKGST